MAAAYYIIGQGIAGTILSMRFYEAGIPFILIDEPSFSQSSRIAAGLANPVVLKRQKWVADAEKFISVAPDFYKKWEEKLDTRFFHSVALEHIFHSAGEINDWQSNSEKPHLKNHLGCIHQDSLPNIHAPHGRASVEGIFWLDTVKFIESWKSFLREQSLLIETDWHTFAFPKQAQRIYCNGYLLQHSHPNLAEAFQSTKGEVMRIAAPELPEDRILHAGVFTLPLGDGEFKVGATYSHKELNQEITEDGLAFLKSKLEVFYKGPYTVLEQWAGVRPNIKDRKPLMGRISESEWTFNGLGSRGVLMAPYLSAHFLEHLLNDAPLAPHWDVKRFI